MQHDRECYLCLVRAAANLAVPWGPNCLGRAMPGGRSGRGVMVCICSRALSLSPSATSMRDSSSMIPSACFSSSSPYSSNVYIGGEAAMLNWC